MLIRSWCLQEAAKLEEEALMANPETFIQAWKEAVIKDIGLAAQVIEKLGEMESQKALREKLELSCTELRTLKDSNISQRAWA